jgi:phosphoglycolate phosphatase-like HAD superfamily hydrolase
VATGSADELLGALARELHAYPAICSAVGDSVWDVEAARAAGMVAIVVAAGSVADKDALQSARPHAIVMTLGDVARLTGGSSTGNL